MLLRQMQANRNAARYSRHFAHIMPFRPHFVREIVAMRHELHNRLANPTAEPGDGAA